MDTHDECLSYTSLKDLLPESTPSIMSPSTTRKDSWREISIKDPLVQHAAWAYLQPMMTAYEDVERGSFFRRIKMKCCGLFECFNDVVLTSVRSLFSSEQGSKEEDEYKLE
ncbi:uncharacterized protein LOC111411041 [Olea europaea var. sylvestris]|uniref:uncharacterized protein LOC111411041 n=1 Tax=Olea europaea var. sylvestris TaxID=158386 RepID=UPI000C1D79BD|nr:uncharacterized protein LOC111411041 [Olea europaea var. sylvestris]